MLSLLKGSWDLVTWVIIRATILITPIKVVVTLLTKSHDPPSRSQQHGAGASAPSPPPSSQDFPHGLGFRV